MFRLSARAFSTSTVNSAAAAKKKAVQGFAKSKTNNKTVAKRIAPGSMYKKWQPAVATANFNKNSTFVELPIFNPNKLENPGLFSFSDKQLQFLYRLGSFKQNQFNELFQRPISMVRDSTTMALFQKLAESENKKIILTGEAGVGKSTLLAQVHAHALENNSLVLPISYPELLTNGRSDFFEDKTGYVQPMFLKSMMDKFKKSNSVELLQSIILTQDHKLVHTEGKDYSVRRNITLSAGKSTLYDLLSVRSPSRSRGAVFDAFIKELTSQTQIPVYFTVDNFSHLLTTPLTSYKNTENRFLHVLEFQIGRTIFDLVSGEISFAHKDSSIILATSGADRTNRTLPIGLGKLPHDPYLKKYHYEPLLADKLLEGKIQEFNVAKLNKEEISKLLEFYRASGILLEKDFNRKSVNELVEEKFFLSGNGNPRQLLKSITLNPF